MRELENGVQGFYYDEELNNRFLSVTLHPNMIIKRDANGKIYVTGEGLPVWVKAGTYEGKGTGTGKNDARNYNNGYGEEGASFEYSSNNATENVKDGRQIQYASVPIARSIVSEDFQVAIANQYSKFGGDPIGELWNSQKPMAPYVAEAGKIFKTIAQKAREWVKNNDASDTIADGLERLSNKIGNSQAKQAEYLNRSLVAQGTRFTYYSGTGTSFGGLNMRYTIFPEYTFDNSGKPKMLTVSDQLRELYPYVIGDYVALSPTLFSSEKDKYEQSSFMKALNTLKSDLGDFAHDWFSWQLPPGGFKPNLHYIDNVQEGTLKLKIGPYYALENLVCENCQLNFSREMVKDPITQEYSPLYCEVNLSLTPATLWTKNALMAFVEGRARDDIDYNKNVMKNNLKREEEAIEELLNSNDIISTKENINNGGVINV